MNTRQILTAKQEKLLRISVLIIGLIVIVTAIGVSIYMYSLNRSLWGDEAMLAYSFSQRSLGELTSSILDYIQSAPVLYLYLVKVITLIFGNSVFTLRVFSFFCYLATIVLSYLIASKLLKIKYPILPAAFVASLTIMLSYSNEFKPYMTDAMAVLIILFTYYLWQQGRMKQYLLVAIFAILIWLSNPVCFFIAAILLYEFVEGVRSKNRAQIQFSIVCGVVVFISFAIYYVYWLRLVVDAGDMKRIWEIKRFPIIPTSVYEVFKIKVIFQQLIEHYGDFRNVIFFFSLIGIPLNIFIFKNRYINIINLGFFITLVASSLGMFPMHDRMCLFIYPLFALLFFFYLSQLYTKQLMSHVLLLTFSLIVLFSARGIETFTDKNNVYFSQIAWAVDSIEQEIGEDDVLLVHDGQWCEYSYLKKFKLEDLPYTVKEVQSSWITEEKIQQAQEIGELGKMSNIYYLTGYDEHSFDSRFLIDTLKSYGSVHLIYNKHEGVHKKYVYSYKREKINRLE